MNGFFKCPFYYLCEKNGIEEIEKESKPMMIGSNIHEIINVYFDTLPSPLDPSMIEKHAYAVMDTNIYPELRRNKRRIKTLIGGFIELEQERFKEAKKYQPKKTEYKFENSHWRGIIDLYYDKTIIDWKSGRQAIITPDLVRQGAVYKISLEMEGLPVDRVQFGFISEKRILTMPETTANWIENERTKMIDMIKHKLFPEKKTLGCRYCKFELRCEFDDVCFWTM